MMMLPLRHEPGAACRHRGSTQALAGTGQVGRGIFTANADHAVCHTRGAAI